MSFGQDLKWRRLTARWVVSGGEQVLDVGTGTGDLASALAQEVGPTGEVVGGLLFSYVGLGTAKSPGFYLEHPLPVFRGRCDATSLSQ